jgi:hypothetical protein
MSDDCDWQKLHDDIQNSLRTQLRLWAGARDVLRAAPCWARDGEDHARPTKHEKAAGVTRAAFLVSRPVASTTVVPTQ